MTIIFSNSCPKIHRLGIFGPKFKDFYFEPLYNQINLRALISNMTMAFFNSSPKIPKWSIFCPKCKYFKILHEASHIEKFKVTDQENCNSFFSNSSQKYPNTKFSLKTQFFFFLSETLSELNFIQSNLIINLLMVLLQSYR